MTSRTRFFVFQKAFLCIMMWSSIIVIAHRYMPMKLVRITINQLDYVSFRYDIWTRIYFAPSYFPSSHLMMVKTTLKHTKRFLLDFNRKILCRSAPQLRPGTLERLGIIWRCSVSYDVSRKNVWSNGTTEITLKISFPWLKHSWNFFMEDRSPKQVIG